MVCPTTGWAKDFNDGQTILDPTFNGKNIVPSGNVELVAARRRVDQQGDGQGARRS